MIAGALLLGACSSTPASKGATGSSSSGSSAGGTEITISNFMYQPMKLTVSPGATISVTNKDQVTHTLTAIEGQFNTGDIGPDQTKTIKAPMQPGTYQYRCNIHQYMMGSIVVEQ